MTDTTQIELPKKHFLIWELMGKAWRIMTKNVWQLLGLQVALSLLFFLLIGVINLLLPTTFEAAWYFQLSNVLASGIVSYSFSIGIITLSLQYADHISVKITDFFSKMHLVVNYFVATFLYGVIVALGFLCLIIPGFILIARLSLYGYLIVDENMGPIEALKASWHLVKGVTWRMLGFILASILISFVGVLCLGVGFLFAFPTITIASACLYRELWKQSQVIR